MNEMPPNIRCFKISINTPLKNNIIFVFLKEKNSSLNDYTIYLPYSNTKIEIKSVIFDEFKSVNQARYQFSNILLHYLVNNIDSFSEDNNTLLSTMSNQLLDSKQSYILVKHIVSKKICKHYPLAFKICSDKVKCGHLNFNYYLGIIYMNGLLGEKDLIKSADCFRTIKYRKNARGELLKVLEKIGTPESINELHELAYEYANKGDIISMYWLAQLYSNPNHGHYNLESAEYWSRHAIEMGMFAAYKPLLKTLYLENSNESIEEMKSIIRKGNVDPRYYKSYLDIIK